MRRDARPGEAGHLSSPDMWYANGCAALAMKGRALLYAASPLHNALGEEDWRLAAEACGEAIAAAEDAGFEMLPKEQWTDNFMNVQYTNEQLWCYSVGNIALSNSRFYGRYGRRSAITRITPAESVRRRISSIASRPYGAIRSIPRRTAPPPSLWGTTTIRTPMPTAIRVST